jgi:hypothetical protein
MKLQSLLGVWVLKHRDEVYSYEENSKAFDGDPDGFTIPEKEYLYFNDFEDCLVQAGLHSGSGPKQAGLKLYEQCEVSYCFIGQYDFENRSICINDSGTFDLKDNGQLHVTISNDDYVCQEIWERLEEDAIGFIFFIEFYISENL